MTSLRLTPIAALALAAAAPAPAVAQQQDPLLGRLIADAAKVNETSFGFERTTEVTRAGKRQALVERYNPAAAEKWTLVSIDGRAPTADDLRKYAEAGKARRAPNYGRVGLILSAGAERAGPDRYRVARLPHSVLDGQAAQFAEHFTTELKVGGTPDKPFISETHVFTPAPFRAKLVAKIEKFEATSRYAPGPDGRPRIRSQIIHLEGSALGTSLNTDTTVTYRDL